MLSCEEFEQLFPFEHTPEILEHQKHCPYCAQYFTALVKVRSALNSLPVLNAPVGFEFRLERRIKGLERASAKEWRITPKALAFASGMVLVLVAGVMLKNAQQSATPPVTSSVPETIVAPTPQPNQDASAPADETPQFVAVEPESTSTASTDSVKIPILNPWEPRWDLEQVSVAP